MTAPLTSVLRARTRHSHEAAERHPFVEALLSDRATPESCRAYLAGLAAPYAALEIRLQRSSLSAGLPLDELARAPALERDVGPIEVASMSAVAWANEIASLPEYGLAGVVYARYLGDLYGGRTLAPPLERAMGASAPLHFHVFRSPTHSLIRAVRTWLDDLTTDAQLYSQAAAAAVSTFEHTQALFDQALHAGGGFKNYRSA